MKKILIVAAHPSLEKSHNNARLLKNARENTNVTIRDLYELYPRFAINVSKEQQYLEANDIVILQHPFYWYSIPALMKQYLDMVFTHGWAYGKGSSALSGKLLFNTLTTSGTRESYDWEAHNRFPLSSYLLPYNQLAYVCGMHYLPPFVLHESGKASQKESEQHASRFNELLSQLSQSSDDLGHLKQLEYLNDWSSTGQIIASR